MAAMPSMRLCPPLAVDRNPKPGSFPAARLPKRSLMPGPIKAYVRAIDALNRVIGRFVMYLIFAMMGVLLLSSGSRTFFGVSYIWVVEMAQFLMTAYYLLGGGYSMQLDA